MRPELSDLEVKILEQLAHKADNADGYDRIAVPDYDLDALDEAAEHLLSRNLVNGVRIKHGFGPRLLAYGLSSLTPRGRAALADYQ